MVTPIIKGRYVPGLINHQLSNEANIKGVRKHNWLTRFFFRTFNVSANGKNYYLNRNSLKKYVHRHCSLGEEKVDQTFKRVVINKIEGQVTEQKLQAAILKGVEEKNKSSSTPLSLSPFSASPAPAPSPTSATADEGSEGKDLSAATADREPIPLLSSTQTAPATTSLSLKLADHSSLTSVASVDIEDHAGKMVVFNKLKRFTPAFIASMPSQINSNSTLGQTDQLHNVQLGAILYSYFEREKKESNFIFFEGLAADKSTAKEARYNLVPLAVMNGDHHALLIIDHQQKELLYFDSYNKSLPTEIEQPLRQGFAVNDYSLKVVDCAKQTDTWSCGYQVIDNAIEFIEKGRVSQQSKEGAALVAKYRPFFEKLVQNSPFFDLSVQRKEMKEALVALIREEDPDLKAEIENHFAVAESENAQISYLIQQLRPQKEDYPWLLEILEAWNTSKAEINRCFLEEDIKERRQLLDAFVRSFKEK